MNRQRVLQHLISLVTLSSLLSLTVGCANGEKSNSNQWFKGGNLHNATVSQWNEASYQNKLATAADWLAATEWKGHLNSPDDFNKIKVKAQMLVDAVDEVVAETEIGSLKVNEIAAAIVTKSNDFSPR